MANLNTLRDMILDEEKLVTYISLSKELCIHVNESKMLLLKFIKNLRQKQPNVDITVNYIVSGLSNKSSARTAVCPEADLEAFKKDFNTIFYEHIYSVTKGSSRLDNASLLATNKLEDLILCTGIIKNNNCIKRTADEIGTLKSNSQDILLNDEPNTHTIQKKVKKENYVTKSLEESENRKDEVRQAETKLVNNIKNENSSPKKSATSKQKVNNVNIKQKGITGFFSKLNGNSGIKNVAEERKKESNKLKDQPKIEIKQENTSEDIEMSDAQADPKDSVQKAIESNNRTKHNKTDDSIKEKVSPVTKKNVKVDKKRKRIVVQSDSESEHENNDNDPFVNEEQTEVQIESDDEIPPTPTTHTVKITSGIVNPRKRRKIVDKTYTSEDGYILTKKEEVYESCSDNEETSKENVTSKSVQKIKVETSPKEKKNEVKSTKKKISPPKSGKQQTLMNFFKKSVN